MNIIILQHIKIEDPGFIKDLMLDDGFNLTTIELDEGEKIPNNKKSIALNVTIQSSEKTLNEEDLEKVNKLIISTVETKSGAKIRS